MKIKVLDSELVQQIAAGEVVEDPSSVIKELIENSIDAQATKIFIKLENGGKDLIKIIDDGLGMSYEDASLALKRHATSKINKIDDLFNIKSLGFRGEALASISSVSKFEMITNDDENKEGTKVINNGNSEQTIEKIASPKGTTIIVKELFFNTPARQKHLKLTSTELTKTIDIITRYAISNPLIYFKVEHNGKLILNSPNTASLFNNLVDIYGKDIAKELLKVEFADNNYSVTGYISKPSVSRIDKNNVSIYVNGRFVKNKVITDALYDAYHIVLHNNRYPFAVLQITIDPHKLDVNIHPAKTKIKIEQENKLYDIIFDLIRNTLKNNNLIPDSDTKLQTMSQSVLSKADNLDLNNKQNKNKTNFEPRYSVQEMKQASLSEINEKAEEVTFSGGNLSDISIKNPENRQEKLSSSNNSEISLENYNETLNNNNYYNNNSIDDSNKDNNNNYNISNHDNKNLENSLKESHLKTNDNDLKYKHKIKFFVLGQLYKTYILCETKDGLMIIDQHAAHERIIFERLMKDYVYNKIIKKQALLSPVKLDLNPRDKAILEDKKEIIKELGFEIEDFGQGTYILRSIPVVIGKQQEKTILLDVIDELISFQRSKSIDEIKKKILSTIACRSAIKAGDELTIERMNLLLKELFECDYGSNCPHGRPTIINITIPELEKRFKRTGF